MGLTYGEAKALGLGHLHPAAAGGKSMERQLLDAADRAVAPPTGMVADGMTKLERSFRDDVLEPAMIRGSIASWMREPIKLRLAGRCWYHPDFMVEHLERLTMVEIKGPYAREDSIIKLKVAAEIYHCFRWLLVRREGRRGWSIWPVDSRGISREPIEVPWIG